MGRIKILHARGGGMNKRFPLKYLPLADIGKNVRIFSQKCQDCQDFEDQSFCGHPAIEFGAIPGKNLHLGIKGD